MAVRLRAAAHAVVLASLPMIGTARAYCRLATCRDGAALCVPAQPDDCDAAQSRRLSWRRTCVGAAVQQDASKQIDLANATRALSDAFAAWTGVSCGGGSPRIRVEILSPVQCVKVEYNHTGGNVNVLVFRDDSWPHPADPHNVAFTTVTYDAATGEIFDADIEVNSALYAFSVSQMNGEYDLRSVLTHEAGHFLGMGHAVVSDATMSASYDPGSIAFRTLEQDDVDGICAAYEPGAPIPTCNPIPRHGFSPACASDQTEGTCAFARSSRACGWSVVLAAFLACGVRRGVRARRRPRSPVPRAPPRAVGP